MMEVNEINRDTRNPSVERGTGETLESYRERLLELLSRVEWQSEGHRQWYTHKNPYGCWICELLQIARRSIDEFMAEEHSDRARDIDDDYFTEEEYNINDEADSEE